VREVRADAEGQAIHQAQGRRHVLEEVADGGEGVAMEYMLIRRDGRVALNKAVNEALSEGWKPLGGIAVSVVPSTPEEEGIVVYAQALVKE